MELEGTKKVRIEFHSKLHNRAYGCKVRLIVEGKPKDVTKLLKECNIKEFSTIRVDITNVGGLGKWK